MDGLNSRQIFFQGKTRCEKKNMIVAHCNIIKKKLLGSQLWLDSYPGSNHR